jgi:CBS domain-containing protein
MKPVEMVLPDYQEVGAAARHATESDADLCVVCDFDGRPVGLVGVDRLIVAAGRTGALLRVRDVAAPLTPGMVAGPGERLADALRRALPSSVLVVLHDGQLAGLITPTEVMHARRRGLLTATTPS